MIMVEEAEKTEEELHAFPSRGKMNEDVPPCAVSLCAHTHLSAPPRSGRSRPATGRTARTRRF